MTIFGVDLHPTYQAGISIEEIRAEGFDWMAVKVSQGTSTQWGAGARAWMARGDACGLITFGYHFLTTADPAAQAAAAKVAAGGRPIMCDAEAGSGTNTNLRAFLAACARIGLRVPLLYLPRWYWQQVGGGLGGLPPLVSSRYRTATGGAGPIYAGVPASWWDGYGGGNVAVLQFSDRASVAGRQVDANAYRGTREQLAALVYGGAAPAAAAPPRSKVRPVLQNYPVVGAGALELNAPIKGVSALYGAAFLSARASPAGGHCDVWWGLSGQGGRGEAHWPTLGASTRHWTELTGGDVDQVTVHYDFGPGNPGVITLELAPK